MTSNEFVSLCNEYTIYPSIALENDSIRKALINRDDKLVIRLLEEEF